MPCADGMPQNVTGNDTEIMASEHEHNHSEHKDHCTPFCVCACCGTMVAMPSAQPILVPSMRIVTEYCFYYSFNYSFEYKEGVWHPPSIC